jgi:hypothetical protein
MREDSSRGLLARDSGSGRELGAGSIGLRCDIGGSAVAVASATTADGGGAFPGGSWWARGDFIR